MLINWWWEWWWVHEHPWLFVILIIGVLGPVSAGASWLVARVVTAAPLISMSCRRGQHYGNCIRGCNCPCHFESVNQSGDGAAS